MYLCEAKHLHGRLIDQKGPSARETKRFTVRALKIFTKHLDAWHCLSGKSCWLNRVHIYFARCHDRVGRRVICVIPEASPNVDIRTIGRVGNVVSCWCHYRSCHIFRSTDSHQLHQGSQVKSRRHSLTFTTSPSGLGQSISKNTSPPTLQTTRVTV